MAPTQGDGVPFQTKLATHKTTSRSSICSQLPFYKESKNYRSLQPELTLKIQLNPFILQKKKTRAKKVNAKSSEIHRVNPKSFLTAKLTACTIERALELNLDSNPDFTIYWVYG